MLNAAVRLSEAIISCPYREELISVITSVRKQRGGLSGLTVKDIVADARVFATRLMKNKVKNASVQLPKVAELLQYLWSWVLHRTFMTQAVALLEILVDEPGLKNIN